MRLYVVCPSVTLRYVLHIGWNTLFENNFTVEQRMVPARIDSNVGYLVRREHPKN